MGTTHIHIVIRTRRCCDLLSLVATGNQGIIHIQFKTICAIPRHIQTIPSVWADLYRKDTDLGISCLKKSHIMSYFCSKGFLRKILDG